MFDPSAAASLLLQARATGQRIAALPEAARPATEAEASAIQRAVAATTGPVGGWKVGAAGPEAPISGAPMPLSGLAAGPATLPAGAMAVEAEVAFRIGADLPPREAAYTREEVIAALESAHPAIEWLACRYLEPEAVDRLSLLADSLLHGGFVHGAGVPAWQALKFDRMTVTQSVAGDSLRRTGNPAGDMIRLVQWLADVGAVWDGGLRAGQFVTCGSWTGKTAVRPGDAVRVHFDGLGDVSVG